VDSTYENEEVEVRFVGRKIGAIGIQYTIRDTVICPRGESIDNIRLKLYDKYNDVGYLTILRREPCL